MDKENDIFNQNPKVQNMNFMFDEDEIANSLEATQAAPPAGRPRQQQQRPAQARRPQQSASSPRQAQPRSARPVQARSMDEESDLFQTRAVLLNQAEPKQVKDEASQKPRQAQPKEAQPRKVQPKNAQARRPQASRSSSGSRPQQRSGQSRPQSAQGQSRTNGQGQARTQNAQSQARQNSPERHASSGRPNPERRSASAQGTRRAVQDPGRVNRTSSGRSNGSGKKGRGKKKGMSGFKKFILIYSAILLVILIVGCIIFSSFLGSLEKSQPSQIAAVIAENFSGDKVTAYLTDNKALINSFGDPQTLIDECANKLQNVEKVSYIENKDYRADAPSYNITADGTTIAKVTLEKDGSGSFGLSKWKVADLNIADYLDTASYEFLAPVGTKITINGTELDDKFKTGEEGVPEFLQNAAKYVTIPSFVTYKVAGIPGDPTIVAKDASGNDLKMTATDNKYVIGVETTEEFINSVKPLVENALDAWGKHFINMGGNLSSYILEGSDWYSYIFGGPDMDPILTAFYEYESIADYSFTEKKADNYIKFTDDCFTVDVSYKMDIDFTTDQMNDDNQKLDATWVFISQNNGQDWYIVDCIYK